VPLSYLSLRQGNAAATKFKKLIDHPGIVVNCATSPGSSGYGRANVISRDVNCPRTAYQDFLEVERPDPDIPVLEQAKKEYTALR
jgi:hypothetical protein